MNYLHFFSKGNTAAANTTFYVCVAPKHKLQTRLVNLGYYQASNTVHLLSLLKPIGQTTIAANVAASATTVVLSADPAPGSALRTGPAPTAIGASTFGALVADNGEAMFCAISAWNATSKQATVTALPAYATTAGQSINTTQSGQFFYFGALTDPHNTQWTVIANSLRQFNPGNNVGVFGSNMPGDPIAVYSNNANSAGYLDCSGGYIKPVSA